MIIDEGDFWDDSARFVLHAGDILGRHGATIEDMYAARERGESPNTQEGSESEKNSEETK